MYSFTRSTAALKPSSVKPETKSFLADFAGAAKRTGDIHGAAQLRHQFIETRLCAVPGIRLAGIHVHNHLQLAGQVVEHHDVVRHHKQDVGRLQRVGFVHALQFAFHVADRVVAEVADQAARKTRHTIDFGDTQTPLEIFYPLQRIAAVQRFAALAVSPDLDTLAVNAHHLPAGQSDNGIAPPFLPPLYGFEQVGIRAAGKLQVGT